MSEPKENVPLAPFTIYKIGGAAKFFIEVKNGEELKSALDFATQKKLRFFIFGAGSNILISDKGFDGLAIRFSGGNISIQGTTVHIDAGVMMARAVLAAADAGLSGFEWAIGVPGTAGGSVRGNAGCFGGEMKDVIESVRVMQVADGSSQNDDKQFAIRDMQNVECEFKYRDSLFKRHPEWIILSATLRLRMGNQDQIRETIKQISTERTEKQAIGTKSCGCIFKNVEWTRKDIDKEKLVNQFPELSPFAQGLAVPAAFLIDKSDFKNRKIGGVLVSPKHANYFVNTGEATAEDIIILASIVKDGVRKKFGILLEEEIQYIGF